MPRILLFFFLSWHLLFFIYLLLAVLGLCCSTGFSLAVEDGGYSIVVVCGLLAVAASLVEHRLQDTQASAAAARGL